MQKCIIYHTGVYISANGVIKDNKVYLQEEGDKLYFPEEIFMAREECEGGLIQFEHEGKWGFADIYTGEIIIDPVWDYAGPFYHGYAHVVLGVELDIDDVHDIKIQGGKHGYIDTDGNIVIPLEYDDGEDISIIRGRYFRVAKNKKWGVVDKHNERIIPIKWDIVDYSRDFIFIAIENNADIYTRKWGVCDKNGNLIVKPKLDDKPVLHEPIMISMSEYNSFPILLKLIPKMYYILKSEEKYGVLCEDGRVITDIMLTKEKAIMMINTLMREEIEQIKKHSI